MLADILQKSRARLASPQPRPTSPVNGAGGITGCWKDARAPESFPSPRIFFHTRLSDSSGPEPDCSARVVSLVAMGRWIDGRANHAAAIKGNFHSSFGCNRGFADVQRRTICIGTRSCDQSAGSLAAIHAGLGDERHRGQPRRQNRPCGRYRKVAGTDQDDYAPAQGLARYVGPGPHTDGPGTQWFFRALGDQIPGSKDDGRLRARGQYPDRSRQTASAGPLRDVGIVRTSSLTPSTLHARWRARPAFPAHPLI
jgi:hypothetical protein